MKNLRGMLNGVALILLAALSANADTMTSISSNSTGFTSTDFSNDALSLNQFNTNLGTLTSVTLELYGTIDASVVSITNNASGIENFSAKAALELYTTGNTASSDELDTDPNSLFSSTGGGNDPVLLSLSSLTLEGSNNGTNPVSCPAGDPSSSCTTVSYGPVTASDAISPMMTTVGSAAWGGYEQAGGGTFTIDANTQAASFFGGGGGNVVINQITDADVTAEVIYTYTTPSTPGVPEPTSIVLMSSALIGIGLLRKRFNS